MESIEAARRNLEIEEITNRLVIHPLAARLVPLFAALKVSPNAVSLTGMAFGIAAGLAYYRYQDPPYAILGFVLMILWHVMDGADGQLARLTHRQSDLGKMLDGICDYITFITVYVALALVLAQQYGDRVWAVVIAAGLCHIVQSAAYEAQRQAYEFWGNGRVSSAPSYLRPAPGASPLPPADRVAALFERAYEGVQSLVLATPVAVGERLAAVLAREPERATAIRSRYRALFAPAIRRWSVLSANYRTLGIFIAAELKAPLYYFWFEVIGFSTILILLLIRQRARYWHFLAGLP